MNKYTDGFFSIDGDHGFLPIKAPLIKLPSPFEPLQALIDDMPIKKKDGTPGFLAQNQMGPAVAALPNLLEEVKKVEDPFVRQALYRAYTFVTSAYLLEPAYKSFNETKNYGKAIQNLPPQVAQPLCWVSDKMNVTPWLDYHYAYSLGNYVKRDPEGGFNWENLGMACAFTGLPDECGFIMVHVDINSFSPGIVGGVRKAAESLKKENNSKENMEELRAGLTLVRDTILDMNKRRREMWKASRHEHYNDFRVFIMGVKGNEEMFGPGVIYEGVPDENGELGVPKAYRGQTGAQDDIIPTLDIFSGVADKYPDNELTRYLLDLRSYRPKIVRTFFTDLYEIFQHGKLASFIVENDHLMPKDICLALVSEIVYQIYLFRNGHWQFVQKYIMANTKYPKATGGTPITSWIPNQIMSTLAQYKDLLDKMAVPPELFLTQHSEADALIKEQIAELHSAIYDAAKVYSMNSEHKLEDCKL